MCPGAPLQKLALDAQIESRMNDRMEALEQLDRLLGTWEKLAERERLCVLTYAMRILQGQKKFGPMTLAKKDWPYEAIEEALDSSVYLTAALNDRVELALARMVSEAEAEVLGEGDKGTDWTRGDGFSETQYPGRTDTD